MSGRDWGDHVTESPQGVSAQVGQLYIVLSRGLPRLLAVGLRRGSTRCTLQRASSDGWVSPGDKTRVHCSTRERIGSTSRVEARRRVTLAVQPTGHEGSL